jgi:hypothetical protein
VFPGGFVYFLQDAGNGVEKDRFNLDIVGIGLRSVAFSSEPL